MQKAGSRGRLDINRRRAVDEYFSLQPFEPPAVPLATLYQIRFISSVYPYPDQGEAGSFEEAIPYEIKMNNLPIDNLKTLPVRRQKNVDIPLCCKIKVARLGFRSQAD